MEDETVIDQNGRFTRDWLFDHWAKRGYAYEHRTKLLELMLKNRFDLVYRLKGDEYIAPQLLPKARPPLEWKQAENLRFRFQYPFKPHGLISRLIVRCHALIHNNTAWREGVLLQKQRAKALVEDRVTSGRGDRIIQIKVCGPSAARKDLLDEVRGEMRSLHHSFHDLVVNEEVPIPQNLDLAVPYDFLQQQRHKGTSHFPWPGIDEELSVTGMLEGLEEPYSEEDGMPLHFSGHGFHNHNLNQANPRIEVQANPNIQFNPTIQVTSETRSKGHGHQLLGLQLQHGDE